MAAVKLAGFVVLIVGIFVLAHFAGSAVGPMTTGHSRIQYTGGNGGAGGSNMGGMNMGGQR